MSNAPTDSLFLSQIPFVFCLPCCFSSLSLFLSLSLSLSSFRSSSLFFLLLLLSSSRIQGQRLSRIHFHMLEVHVIANKPDVWLGSASAVAHGTLTCSQKACNCSDDAAVRVLAPTSFALSAVPSSSSMLLSPDNMVPQWKHRDWVSSKLLLLMLLVTVVVVTVRERRVC